MQSPKVLGMQKPQRGVDPCLHLSLALRYVHSVELCRIKIRIVEMACMEVCFFFKHYQVSGLKTERNLLVLQMKKKKNRGRIRTEVKARGLPSKPELIGYHHSDSCLSTPLQHFENDSQENNAVVESVVQRGFIICIN